MSAARPDVLSIDGGIIEVPGRPVLGRFGLGSGLAYACMAETMLLALDGHLQNSSLGTDLTAESLCRLHNSARRHGFRWRGCRLRDATQASRAREETLKAPVGLNSLGSVERELPALRHCVTSSCHRPFS